MRSVYISHRCNFHWCVEMKSARTTTSRKASYAPEGDLKFAAKEPLEISICFLGLALSNGKKFAMERLFCPHRWSLDSLRECHSSQSFYCLYTKHLPEDSRRCQQADLLGSVTLPLSDTFLMFSTIPFFTVPSAQTTTTFSVFLVVGLCTYFSFRFPSVRCFYLME